MTNSKESYKLLNAELMAEVQKLRLIVAAYKRQVTTLVRENMGLREAQILQGSTGDQRQNEANGVRKILRHWKLDSNCLGSSSVSRATRTLSSTNSRRYGDIDFVVEEAPEIGRLKLAIPPVIPTIDEDAASGEEDDGWQPDNKDTIIRKITRFCWRRSKFL